MSVAPERFTLRTLPLAVRLVLAVFLLSVGAGYCAALLQLHFQHASPGKLLPGPDDAVRAYHGGSGLSQLERLLMTEEGKPFNGSGTMRAAFTAKSGGWKAAVSRRAKKGHIDLNQAEAELRSEREGERLALLDWVRAGAEQKAFADNSYAVSADLASHPITGEFVEEGADGKLRVKIASIFETRCARCHDEGKSSQAAQFPLGTWEQIHDYCEVETAGGGMSLKKLAQSTHVHLFGFTLLYSLTGLILACSSYPTWLKCVLAPFPLLAQFADVGCWWLARVDPFYAQMIVVTGGLVALGLSLQIVLSLFNLFGRTGKVVLLVLFLALAVGGYEAKVQLIDPYLAKEKINATELD
jgi:hypothetical protein